MWRIVAVLIGRRGDDRQEVRDLRERLGRDAHRLVDLAPDELQLERRARVGRLERRRQQAVDVVAVPGVGRDASGARVRVGEQAVLLEHRQLVADRRGPAVELGVRRQRLRSDGQAADLVGADHLAEDELLSRAEVHAPNGRTSPRRYSASSARALRMIAVPSCTASASTTAMPSSTDATRPVTTISCSGSPMPRNWTLEALERRRAAAGRLRRGAGDERHRVEAVQDPTRQADRLGELLVDVDRVVVPRGARVADRQVLVRRDLQLGELRALLQRHGQTPRTMFVHVPTHTVCPAWFVETDSKT